MAADFLAAKGMTILDRQWRHPLGEIDLVAQLGDELVFVEVKTRHHERFGTPEAAVTPSKLQRLQALAEAYVVSRHWSGKYRIDVIGILAGTPPKIRHLAGVS